MGIKDGDVISPWRQKTTDLLTYQNWTQNYAWRYTAIIICIKYDISLT